MTDRIKKLYGKLVKRQQEVNYAGDFQTWSEAKKNCEGYDSNSIFEKVSNAAMQVKNGKALFDRDSVLFYEEEWNYPLIAWLQRIGAKYDQRLTVVDLGGALGSTYFQNRNFLKESIRQMQWIVREQEHFVEFGKQNLADTELIFEYDFEKIAATFPVNVLLFSSVLQYLESWKEIITKEIDLFGVQDIIVERTPVGKRSRIWMETVHEPIYEATYACQVFEEERFIEFFEEQGYVLKSSWHSLVDSDVECDGDLVTFKSFVFGK